MAAMGIFATAFIPEVIAQIAPPTESKGVAAKLIGTIPLAPEISGIDNRQLRMRVVTLEPGGVVAMHSHKGRPAVAYALQGTLTEHLENGDVRDHSEGEAWTEDRNVTHWAENKGDKPVMVIAVDVFKPQ